METTPDEPENLNTNPGQSSNWAEDETNKVPNHTNHTPASPTQSPIVQTITSSQQLSLPS